MRSANHRLLLYDHEDMSAPTNNLLGQAVCRACFPEPFSSVHAAVVPSQHALAFSARNRSIHEICIPLSYQICCRYLRGFDLDYTRTLVGAVQNGVVDGIKYLFVIHAIQGAEGEPSPQHFKLNRNRFRPINQMNRDE